MKKYICTACGYIYDPAEGDPDNGIEPGTSFADIPDDWVCPICGVGKDEFVLVMAAGPSQLSWPALRAHLGQSRMTMATREEVLDVTGYPIGTVAPIGLPQPIRILADKNIFAHDEISFGSGKHNTAIIMQTEEFKKIIGTKAYSALLQILKDIGPDARTHRISILIAAILRFAVSRLPTDYGEGTLGQAS